MADASSPKISQRVDLLVQNPNLGASVKVGLDFRLFIIGDFSRKKIGSQGRLFDRRLHEIRSKRDFNYALEAINPRLVFLIPDRLSNTPDAFIQIELDIKALLDFHPDRMILQVRMFWELLRTRENVKALKWRLTQEPEFKKNIELILQEGKASVQRILGMIYEGEMHSERKQDDPESLLCSQICTELDEERKAAVTHLLCYYLEEYAHSSYSYDGIFHLIDECIGSIDKILSTAMDEILHHTDFQALESLWRELHFLMQRTDFSKPIQFVLLDCPKEELFEDLEGAALGEGYERESGVWHHLYWHAYEIVGGHPFTAIIADYQFDNSPHDIKLLQHLSILGERLQAPFIGNASAHFFQHENFAEVITDRFLLERVKDSNEYTAWRNFRSDSRAKYIGLCLPRFLGRLPYGPENDPIRNFIYEENIYDNGKNMSLWCNASFAFAVNLVKCFEQWGWSTRIAGLDTGGQIEDLPVPVYSKERQNKPGIPLEVAIGASQNDVFTQLGFMPVIHLDRSDRACFFNARSVHRPDQFTRKREDSSFNETIAMNLEYTLLAAKVAHCLNYYRLRYIGRNRSKDEIHHELSAWLSALTIDQPNPPESVIAERPLREYQLHIEPQVELYGKRRIKMTLLLRPHVAIIGTDVTLKVESLRWDDA